MHPWRIVEESTSPPIEAFLDDAWNAYHVGQQHDLSAVWKPLEVLLTARDEDGTLLGVARGDVRAGVGHLSELMVHADSRKLGVGGALLAEFERRCWLAGCHKLALQTEATGPARAFYEQRGWRAEAVLERDYLGLDYVRLVLFRADGADEEEERS